MPSGARGEQALQEKYGTTERARIFYARQVRNELNIRMQEFIAQQEMFFLSTADSTGSCDCSFRAGPPGFVCVLDNKTLLYPELAGNGIMASLGNIHENPHIAILFMDFATSRVGLHVNGAAKILENEEAAKRLLGRSGGEMSQESISKVSSERWVLIEVQEAYMHCAKHVPSFVRRPGTIDWSKESMDCKKQDFFGIS